MTSETTGNSVNTALPQSAYMKNLSTETVDAQVVQMHQSGASMVNAASVEAVDSFLGDVATQSAVIHGGMTGFIKTDHVTSEQGFTGVMAANDAQIKGIVGVTMAQSVRVTNSNAGLVVAREVHGGKMHTVFLLTTRMDAPVETVVEPRSIALFGAAAGLTFGLVYSLFRWLRSKS
jgi:hypothetical protein